MPLHTSFGGDKKIGQSLLHRPETYLKNALVPLVPASVQTHHLTLLTIPWSLLVLLFSMFAQQNIDWLWAVTGVIVLQYITDLLDGEIGRRRDTGLIKWGYYMDHLLDYVFLCALLIGYFFIAAPGTTHLQFYLLAIFGAYMVNSFLAFAATNEFQISHLGIGPTEVRLGFIVVNVLLATFGVMPLSFLQPYLLIAAALGLIVTVYRTQCAIWKMDMQKMKADKR